MSTSLTLFKILFKVCLITIIAENVAEGQSCPRSTPPCQFNCNCAENNWCEYSIEGKCSTKGCERRWSGPKCQRENVVLGSDDDGGQTLIGSSRVKTDPVQNKYWRLHAFDGDSATLFATQGVNDPYLWVNMESVQTVNRIKITTSAFDPSRIAGFSIHVDNNKDFTNPQLCYKDPVNSHFPVEYDITCLSPLNGQYVRIQVPGNKVLVLQEMEIYRCADYWFGDQCDKPCTCKTRDEICNKTTGGCVSGCATGYAKGECQVVVQPAVCPDGSYGQGCTAKCGNCRIGDVCDKVNGICQNGCAFGYQGVMCDNECSNGYYGTRCSSQCHCLNNQPCDKNGACPAGECSDGYTGRRCNTACKRKFYGQDCSEPCGNCRNYYDVCDKSTGKCPNGCADGYQGEKCKECSNGYYGTRCSSQCHCQNNQPCDKNYGDCPDGRCSDGYSGRRCNTVCTDGRYGPDCRESCGNCRYNSDVCNKSTGKCPNGCADGYQGDKCKVCKDRRYGPDCRESCGNCRFTSDVCDKSTGKCPNGCADRYQGDKCKVCKGRRYGQDCGESCGNCRYNSDVCNKSTGKCPNGCADGYQGDQCIECSDGYYGSGCRFPCGSCKNKFCNKITGYCPAGGCSDGYTGLQCTEECINGYYGFQCGSSCGHCWNNQSCDKITGDCPADGCSDGYTGRKCNTVCDNGYYGEDCAIPCGNCVSVTTCNNVNGTCAKGCKPGSAPPKCASECDNGRYGPGCSIPCGKCIDGGICNKTTGYCPGQCSPGFQGKICHQECQNRTFGLACKKTCHCSNDAQCNSASGECGPVGCTSGYSGDSCQISAGPPLPSAGAKTGIIGAVIGVIVLLIIVVVVVVLVRKRKGFVYIRKWFACSKKAKSNDAVVNEGFALNVETGTQRPVEEAVSTIDAQEGAIYANTMDVGRSPTAICLAELVEFVNQELNAAKPFEEEFLKLPKHLTKSTEQANKGYNVLKCRYRAILPYDDTRVVLDTVGDDPTTDFINASYVEGYGVEKAYIASQGTTQNNIDDFWRMIWQQKIGKIVMLTQLYENGKEKVLQYWPDKGVRKRYGDVSVEVTETEHHVDHCVRFLQISYGPHVRNIKQFQFLAWPDHDVPRDTVGVIELRDKVNRTPSSLSGPIVVHCSAGVGRTGTYIAFGNLMKTMESENEVDIFQTVVQLRNQRTHMVQTKEQYAFVHRALRDSYLCRGSVFTTEQIANMDLNSTDVTQRIQNEFEALNQICKLFSSTENETGNTEARTRPTDISNRIWFHKTVPGGKKFIDVMNFPMEREKSRLICTKIPDKEGKLDFWRMVYEEKCSSLILLTQLSQNLQYWPTEDTPLKIGPFEISLVKETKKSNIMTIRQLLISSEQKEFQESHSLQHICFTGWAKGENGLPTADHMISLKKQAMDWESQHEPGAVIVHCRDGMERSGLFAVCDFLLDRLKTETSINLLLSAKRFRTICPNTMTTLAHYRFCYQVLKAYLDTFSTYANFT